MKTFVVIGLGRFGEAVARKLCELGHEVLVIDESESKIERISEFVTHAVIADAKDDRTLKSLGIRNYDCAILAIGQVIADSVLITMALKEMGIREVICKAMNVQHKKILLKIGADRVIIPEHEAGTKLAIQIAGLNLLEFLELGTHFGLSEMNVPSKWVSRSLMELDLRNRYYVTVVAVKKSGDEDEVIMAPGASYRFEQGDLVVLIGKNEDINTLSRM